jgi:RHS repeat-associated protein
MQRTPRLVPRAVFNAILVVTFTTIVWSNPAHAQNDIADPDFSYDMFYPKYAKGRQPTAYDVGDFDSVNLYNGGLSLTIPLGPPLVAGADLSWQLALHYSSKFWSWDRRENGKECQGKGFIVGDAHAGLGWSFKLPHVFLRQQWDAAIGAWRYYLDSVVSADGAQHQLRRCLEGWDCRDGGPAEVVVGSRVREYWFSADGSDWRIYRDRGLDEGFPGLLSTGELIGEQDGLRFHFTLARVFEYGQADDDLVTDTDFLSQARGWYCTRIESIRWPGPSIEIAYDLRPEGSPIPKAITALDAAGQSSASVDIAIDPVAMTVSRITFIDGAGAEQLHYELSYQRSRVLRVKILVNAAGEPLCASNPDFRLFTDPFSYLTGLHLQTKSGIGLDWDFGVFQEEADPPGEPDGELDAEPKGRIRSLTLPTGAVTEYTYDKWTFFYQGLGPQLPTAPGPVLIDVAACGSGDLELNIGSDPPPGPLTYSARQPVWAVTNRRVVDTDDRLLEWTEYLRDGVAGILFNLYEPPFDFANTVLSAPGGGRALLPNPVTDPDFRDHFYSGIAMTVVRRHMVVDNQPGPAAEDLGSLRSSGYTIDLPNARFDDTAHIFSTGRFFYDSDDDGLIAIANQTDVWGTLPLEGRPLEVRSYRGAHHVDGEDFWYCTDETHPRLERRTLLSYTLDREDDTPTDNEHVTLGSAWLGGYEQYSGARQENVQIRRQTTQYMRASLLEDAEDDFADPLNSGTESWFERDVECQPDDCVFDWRTAYGFTQLIAEPTLPSHGVIGLSTSDFTVSVPGPADFDLRTTTSYEKDFTSAIWLPDLVHEKLTTLASPASFERTTTTFRTNGAVDTSRRHVSLSGSDSDDITTTYDYWGDSASGSVFGYGRPKTVSLERSGSIDSLTGSRYIASPGGAHTGPFERESWILCPPGAATKGRCPGWGPAPAAFGSTGELKRRVAFDPFWRRATALSDGNGDGLMVISHDELGRLKFFEPSDASKSPTWVEYDPNLRWSEVRVENVDGSPTLVRRSHFDGLGRLRHHEVRRAGPAGLFHHQTKYYDGAGTTWAESHVLPSADLTPPTSFSANDDWEITAAVDPFRRPERQVASDGGLVLSGYRGNTWSQTLVLDPALGTEAGLSRTITRRDARGQTIESWEDKGAPASDPPHFLTVSQMKPWRFVRGFYEYDVGGRTTEVEVRGQDVNATGRVQRRTMQFNALGELLTHTFPEHGAGNGTILYENSDAFGTPRLTVLATNPLEAIETTADAAGREIERRMLYGGDRYLVGSVVYGTDAGAHEVGKVVRETRYNLVSSSLASCSQVCIEPNSVSVTHTYSYVDSQGLLSGRTTEVGFGGQASTDGIQPFSLGYEYDRWGNPSRIYYPELTGITGCTLTAPTIDLEWDPVALNSITDATTGVALFSEPGFDPATGMLVSWNTATGTLNQSGDPSDFVKHLITVDGTRARPLRITAVNPADPYPALFDTGTYTYDAADNIRSIGQWSYAYDDLGRLTSSIHPNHGAQDYDYDDFGNLAQLGERTIPISWATNRLTSATYDRRGNLTTETTTDGWTRRLRFDLDNQLVAAWATGPNAPSDRFGFAYDLSGERVLKYRVTDGSVVEATFSLRDEGGNVLTDFLWAPSTVGNTTGNWHRLSDHVFLGRRPLVHRQSQGDYPVTYTTVVTDHLQSTRKEVSDLDNPAAQSTFTYWPFGEFAERLGTPAAKHLYTAHEREDTGIENGTMSGLDYMHARYFSQVDGRFLGVDPIDTGSIGVSQSWSLYTYVRNSPNRNVDPLGMWLRDMHQHLTTYLALQAGFSLDAARQIGNADANVDRQRPPVPWRPTDFHLHFMSRDESVGYFEIRAFLPGNEFEQIGAALHSVQDSFSHSLAGWPLGHGIDNLIGESPDDTWRYPDTTMEMAEETLELLGGNLESLDRDFLWDVFLKRSETERTTMLLLEIARIGDENAGENSTTDKSNEK